MLGGFRFEETMVGSFQPKDGSGERAIAFRLVARASSWLGYLRDRKARIEGEIDMDGFASRAPLSGDLTITPILGRVIHYRFEFFADDRKRYVFDGKKDVTALRPVHSMTHLSGEIRDSDGHVFATAKLEFPLGDLPGFVGSFRPWT